MIKPIGPLAFALLFSFVAVPVFSMRCENSTVRTYVRCTEDCTLFSDFLKISGLIDTCNSKVRFGCKLEGCSDNGGFKCTQNPDHPFPICANDVTIFDETDVDNVVPANFMIDVNAPPLKIQYYFLVDTSSSMAPHIGMVQWKINELVEMYKTMPDIEAKFAIGEYRDPRFGGSHWRTLGMCGLRRIRDFTNDVSLIQQDVNGLSVASGTHSGPEGLLPSIAQAAAYTPHWDSGARKIIIVFGDAPGYEKTKHDLPSRDIPHPLTRQGVVSVLKERNITLIGVNIGAPGLDGATEPYGAPAAVVNTGQISHIAGETGGVITSPTKTLMQAVIEAKERYVREYTMDAADCQSKGVVVNDGNEFRVQLRPSASSTVQMSMIVRQRDNFCLPFECNISFKEDGIPLVPMGMRFLKLNGCVAPP